MMLVFFLALILGLFFDGLVHGTLFFPKDNKIQNMKHRIEQTDIDDNVNVDTYHIDIT